MNLHHRATAVVAAVGITLTLAACGGATEPATDTAAGSQTSTAGATPAAANNDADTQFAQNMVIHHEGAIDMADLAVENATTEEVRALGERISAAQGPEIDMMTGWLDHWGDDMPHDSAMGDMDAEGMEMGGMTQDEAMEELQGLSGTDFDRRFLELMIEHHRGAIDMAQAHHEDGDDPNALALSDKIINDQQAEITEMEQLLQGL